jgi:biopolymer transport protein ExbB
MVADHNLGFPNQPVRDSVALSEAQKALDGRPTALTALVRAALHEVRLSGESASDAGIKERSASRFTEIARAEARSMRQGMAILATIGATSPFVGLFGTVWVPCPSMISPETCRERSGPWLRSAPLPSTPAASRWR